MAMIIGQAGIAANNAAIEMSRLARTNALHYTADGGRASGTGLPGVADAAAGNPGGASFATAMLKAMEGVNASQLKSTDLLQQMSVDPESVDAQDVTIAMAEANLSLNLARTIMDRVVRGWKEVINTR
jgi:flagellar hook-basal body complex protein FliE